MPHTLVCHPDTPPSFPCAIQVTVSHRSAGGLALRYRIQAEPQSILVPEPAPPARANGLWRHTCCELFAAPSPGGPYREFNFSPSGQWQAYEFAAYRQGGLLDAPGTPDIHRHLDADGLALLVDLPADFLPPAPGLALGLTVVLEDRQGAISYWALAHAPGKPDFHHPATFALSLDLPPSRP